MDVRGNSSLGQGQKMACRAGEIPEFIELCALKTTRFSGWMKGRM